MFQELKTGEMMTEDHSEREEAAGMDLEGYAERYIRKGGSSDEEISEKMTERILEIRETGREEAKKLADAVLKETRFAAAAAGMNEGGKSRTGDAAGKDVLHYAPSGVTVGRFGIGSRGRGDFYAHGLIGRVIGKTNAVIDSSDLDDSGIVSSGDSQFVVVTVDGIHSRLSAFPFLSGFHAARAALRDIYTMGSRPLAMLSDVHIADDGDVSVLFDHIAGISAVGELTGIPLVTGSTLRIGGDMVIGTRMTGCVGAVGTLPDRLSMTSRNKTEPGDVILMTEGAGGGTVVTAAIYSGYEKAPEVIEKTLNVDFLMTCDALIESGCSRKAHAMTDVTNGGIRGDAAEISKEAGVRLVFRYDDMIACVAPEVLDMFRELNIDPLGVSIDSLLIICPPEDAAEISETVRSAGVNIREVGRAETGSGVVLIKDGEETDFTPLFRESAYTPVKKVVGEKTPDDFEEMKKAVDKAADDAVSKKERIVGIIREKQKTGK